MSNLLNYLSFASFLLLTMDATTNGILQTAFLLLLGALVFFQKKLPLKFQGSRCSWLLSGLIIWQRYDAAFYGQWVNSSVVQRIASIVHLPHEALVEGVSIVLCLLTAHLLAWLIDQVLGRIVRKLPYEVSALVVAYAVVALTQFQIGYSVFDIEWINFLMEMALVSAVILLLRYLTNLPGISLLAGSLPFMVIATANVYVWQFRWRLFEPADLMSIKTAMNVAENYSLFPIPEQVISAWRIWAGTVLTLTLLQPKEKRRALALTNPGALIKRLVPTICCVGVLAGVFVYSTTLKTYHWREGYAENYGYLMDFMSKISETWVSKPKGYSETEIANLAEHYAEDSVPAETEKLPHIIVVMSESFSDLSILGDFATNQEVTPFISNLRENAITGYAVSSVYGGNTANSEFEFLTGNSMAWLSPNVVPYHSYIHGSSYSMVSYLKGKYNYRCIAMHPFLSSGWDRPTTYTSFGFDEMYFLDDFPQENLVRNYVSDQEMYEYIIQAYESRQDQPLFVFSISMQNHGSYIYRGDNLQKSIQLVDFEEPCPTAEQYLSLLHETDQATEELIAYFAEAEEPVVILFFGDHQPALTEAFYRQLGFGGTGSLEELQKQHLVPFFIWANYELEEQYVEYTSLNYLSSYVYQAAGLSLPLYNRFLTEMESVIPVISSNGIYSREAGAFLSLGDASESEQVWLRQYEQLQYNDLFASNRNEAFFPTM